MHFIKEVHSSYKVHFIFESWQSCRSYQWAHKIFAQDFIFLIHSDFLKRQPNLMWNVRLFKLFTITSVHDLIWFILNQVKAIALRVNGQPGFPKNVIKMKLKCFYIKCRTILLILVKFNILANQMLKYLTALIQTVFLGQKSIWKSSLKHPTCCR